MDTVDLALPGHCAIYYDHALCFLRRGTLEDWLRPDSDIDDAVGLLEVNDTILLAVKNKKWGQ